MQSRHDALNTFATELALLAHLHNRCWVVFTDDTTSCLLNIGRGFPGLVDVLSGEVTQLRNVGLDERTIHVHLFANEAGVEALNLVTEEPTAGALHPANGGNRELKIQHELLEEILPQHPGDPEVAASEEDSDALSGKEMGPSILSALTNDGVDPGVARLALSPRLEVVVILIPGQLDAEGVAVHQVKLGGRGPDKEGKLPEEKILGELLEESLASSGDRGELAKFAEQLARREAAKTDVGAEGVLAHQPVNWVF